LATIAKIRRAYFVQGKALEAISRELKISRKVVRRGDPVGGDGIRL
jgi:DNA-binding transcriptional regulator LsrR (DeoR family)